MTPDFHDTDLQLLIALHENPMARFSELAEKLHLSPTTISNRYHDISHNSLNRVVADVNLDKLDLEILDFLIETDSLENSETIEKYCDDHYYTLYRSRLFGKFNGLFVQFRIPKGTHTRLLNQLETLQHDGLINSFNQLNSIYPKILTRTQLTSWKGGMKWEFNWNDWELKLNELLQNKNYTALKPQIHKNINDLDHLDMLDLLILEELTIGCARRKNIELIQEIEPTYKEIENNKKITKQTFSRRINRIKKDFIQNYRLFFDLKTLDIYNTIAFLCRTDNDLTVAISHLLTENPIPFSSNYRPITENSFFWFLRVPPSHFSSLYNIIWKYASELDVFLFDYNCSRHYGLWHKAFIEKTNSWKIDY